MVHNKRITHKLGNWIHYLRMNGKFVRGDLLLFKLIQYNIVVLYIIMYSYQKTDSLKTYFLVQNIDFKFTLICICYGLVFRIKKISSM